MSQLESRGQIWPECDATVRDRILNVVTCAREFMQDKYVGTYLHGSLATGCFYPPKSDIDLLVVVSEPLDPKVRERLARSIASNEAVHNPVGGIELSVITRDFAKSPTKTPPYEMHYSQEWSQRIVDGKVDWTKTESDGDLPAHLMMTERRGIAIDGPPVSEVFSSVAWENYVQAVHYDFDWIVENENIAESPFYGVLNICRTLELLTSSEKNVLSKEEGAIWALQQLPKQHHPIIKQALRAYRSTVPVPPEGRRTNGESWDHEALLNFRHFARTEVASSG